MQVSVESVGAIGRRLTITLPAEELEEAIKSRLQRLAKQVKMPGFRPGKVPMKMVEAQYGPQIMREVSGELIQTSYQQALGQEGLRPAGGPKIVPKTLERGRALEFVAEFDVYPEAKQLDLSGQTIVRPTCDITEADIDRTVETIRKQQQTWQTVERQAKLDDQVTMDFEGSIGGELFQGGKGTDVQLVLGSGMMIAGFEDQLVGVSANDQRTITVTFPQDYRAKDLAGKEAQFAVKVKKVEEPVLPELNDEFVAKLGIENGNMEKLRSDVKENLEREMRVRQRNILRDRVLEALIKVNDLDVPRSLVEREIEHMKQSAAQNQQAQGLLAQDSGDDAIYEKAAKRRVLLGLVVSEIVKQKNISADPAKVRERVEELAAGYESPEDVIRWHYEKPERLQGIEAVVLEEKVVEALIESAKVEDKPMGFQDLIQESMAAN